MSIAVAKAELKQKFETGIIAAFWYLLNPILTFVLLYLGFQSTLGTAIPHYPLYLALGIITVHFFTTLTQETTKLFYDNRFTVKAIPFPLESIILGIVGKILVSHIGDALLFTIVFIGSGISISHLLYYPLFLAILALTSTGAAFFLSIVGVYIVDLPSIWIFVVRLLWFITPIFYIAGSKSVFLQTILSLNPLAYILTSARSLLIDGTMGTETVVAFALSILIFLGGIGIFEWKKFNIPEKL